MNRLSSIEKARYARHFSLSEIGLQGQEKIKNTRVLCVGAGGLGSSVLYYLAAAGVGTLGIIDPDTVDHSNLQRQILYTTEDVGKSKVEQTKNRLLALNPHIEIITYPISLTEDNAFTLFADYDLIVDATDNYTAHYLINDVCCLLNKPDVFASILRFKGHCSIFGLANAPCYRCVFPNPPTQAENCSEAGVLGVLPGLLGCLQATEVLKWCVGAGDLLIGRLLSFDALKSHWTEYQLTVHPQCPLCSQKQNFKDLIRPSSVCKSVPEITVTEFKELKEDYFLLDVREIEEYQQHHMNGFLIPLGELETRFVELDKEKLIIVHCRSGYRSEQAAAFLIEKGFKRVYNLQGGILAWGKSEPRRDF